jgi:hypothetical protein
MPEYICEMSLDNLCTGKVVCFRKSHLSKNKNKSIRKELKCKRDEFVLTWSEWKFVSSFEAP